MKIKTHVNAGAPYAVMSSCCWTEQVPFNMRDQYSSCASAGLVKSCMGSDICEFNNGGATPQKFACN